MTREEQRDTACTNWICSQENGTVIKAREVWKAAVEWADSHPAWVSVEKELPRERGYYLAYTEYGQVWLTEYMQDKGGYWDWFVAPICVGAVSKVTHWMQLPQPPVKKGGEL